MYLVNSFLPKWNKSKITNSECHEIWRPSNTLGGWRRSNHQLRPAAPSLAIAMKSQGMWGPAPFKKGGFISWIDFFELWCSEVKSQWLIWAVMLWNLSDFHVISMFDSWLSTWFAILKSKRQRGHSSWRFGVGFRTIPSPFQVLLLLLDTLCYWTWP